MTTLPTDATSKDLAAIERAERYAKSLHTTAEEHDDIMVAVRLARASLAPPSAAPVGDLRHIIDRDRYVAAACLGLIEKVLDSRAHLAEPGRGSYEWDDERYQQEFGLALGEIREALVPLARLARDKTDCTTDPDKVREARAAGAERFAALHQSRSTPGADSREAKMRTALIEALGMGDSVPSRGEWIAMAEDALGITYVDGMPILPATPEPAPYWLIERRCSPPQYSSDGSPFFVSDPMHGRRFPTEAAALNAMRRWHATDRADCFVSEHTDVALAASPVPVDAGGALGKLVAEWRERALSSAIRLGEAKGLLSVLADVADILNAHIDAATYSDKQSLGDWPDDHAFDVSVPWAMVRDLNDTICKAQRWLKDAALHAASAPVAEGFVLVPFAELEDYAHVIGNLIGELTDPGSGAMAAQYRINRMIQEHRMAASGEPVGEKG